MDWLQAIRDVAIIILAIESIVLLGAILFLVLQAWKIVGLARRHLDTIGSSATEVLGTVQETTRNVQGTTTFVADRTARPVIELYSAIAGASAFTRALLSPKPERPPEDTP